MSKKILLDECLPKKLKRELPDHNAFTVSDMGWSGKKNGELLRLMVANNFEVFVTADQNLQYQQEIMTLQLSIIVLIALKNNLASLVPLMPQVRTLLLTVKPGSVIEVK